MPPGNPADGDSGGRMAVGRCSGHEPSAVADHLRGRRRHRLRPGVAGCRLAALPARYGPAQAALASRPARIGPITARMRRRIGAGWNLCRPHALPRAVPARSRGMMPVTDLSADTSRSPFATHVMPDLPSLAWLLDLERDRPRLVCGTDVEILGDRLFEGCWNGRFEARDFDRA